MTVFGTPTPSTLDLRVAELEADQAAARAAQDADRDAAAEATEDARGERSTGDDALTDAVQDEVEARANADQVTRDLVSDEMEARIAADEARALEIDQIDQQLSSAIEFPDVIYYSPAALRKWARARARVASGVESAYVCIAGDSNKGGSGAGSGVNLEDGAVAYSAPRQLAALLTASGIPTRCDAQIGAYSSTFTAYNPAFSNTNWTVDGMGVDYPAGKALWKQASPNTNALTLDYTAANVIDVYLVNQPGQGAVTIELDSVTYGTYDTNAAAGIQKVTVNAASVGSHRIKLQRASGGDVRIAAFVPRDTTRAEIIMINLASSGYTADKFTSGNQPWSATNMLKLFAPALTLIQFGINEAVNDTGKPLYASTLTFVVVAARLSGDVVMEIPWNVGSSGGQAQNDRYWNTGRQVARDNGCPTIDFSVRFGSYADIDAAGWASSINHLKREGYSDQALAERGLLLR